MWVVLNYVQVVTQGLLTEGVLLAGYTVLEKVHPLTTSCAAVNDE